MNSVEVSSGVVGVGGAGGEAEGAGGGNLPVPSTLQPRSVPVVQRMRAYFAPVDRQKSAPTFFDPSQATGFDPDNPPAPWVDLGWIENFTRRSTTKFAALRSGTAAGVQSQVRQDLQATVGLRFLTWGKLQMALAAGSEQMNLLATAAGTASPSGGSAVPAITVGTGCTSTSIVLSGKSEVLFDVGDCVAVDADYSAQTGYVGAGASGAYISDSTVPLDADYIRRMTLNVGTIAAIGGSQGTTLTLTNPLLGGAPAAGMGVQQVVGFVDREGGSFFHEWSALFAAQGAQGDWVFYHYPRLQAMQGAAEIPVPLASPLQWLHLDAQFVALPVTDPNDGAQVVSFRSYLPAPNTTL